MFNKNDNLWAEGQSDYPGDSDELDQEIKAALNGGETPKMPVPVFQSAEFQKLIIPKEELKKAKEKGQQGVIKAEQVAEMLKNTTAQTVQFIQQQKQLLKYNCLVSYRPNNN